MNDLVEQLLRMYEDPNEKAKSIIAWKYQEKQYACLAKQQKELGMEKKMNYYSKSAYENKNSEERIKQTVAILHEKQLKEAKKKKKSKILKCNECSETFESKREAKLHNLEKHAVGIDMYNPNLNQYSSVTVYESFDFDVDLASDIKSDFNSIVPELQKVTNKVGPPTNARKIKSIINPSVQIIE